MPSLAQVRNFVDARLTTLWTDVIVPRQDTYFANNGKFWQGIRCLDLGNLLDNPQNALNVVLEMVPDLTRKPTDQATSWAAANVNLGATIPMALQIDVYDGPEGKGYVGQVWAKWNGTIYTRAQNHGPESWRTFAWRVAEAGS
jgi:hypothetical protein